MGTGDQDVGDGGAHAVWIGVWIWEFGEPLDPVVNELGADPKGAGGEEKEEGKGGEERRNPFRRARHLGGF